MIANLGMYDRPETAAAHDALWAAIRDRLRVAGHAAPEALTRDRDLWEIWQSPDLLLGQTCGLPYRAVLHGKVSIVCTLDYGLAGAPAGHYLSLAVSRRDGPATLAEADGARLAYNDALSQSGWAAACAVAEAAGITYSSCIASGAHRVSARMIAEGSADLALIDAITWRGIVAYEPELAEVLSVIGQSAPTPGLPLITAAGRDPAPLRAAVIAALDDLPRTVHDRLGLAGFTDIPTSAYLAVPNPPDPSQFAQNGAA